MKQYTLVIIISIIIASCRTNKNPILNSYSDIAEVTNNSEQEDLSNSLSDFANVSNLAKGYVKQLPQLEARADELKTVFEKEHSIPSQDQKDFIDSFKSSLKYISISDSSNLELLSISPVRSQGDIDQLLLFMKRLYVKNILGTERCLFNTYSIMCTAENLNIKNGEDFSVQLGITAANRNTPAEWFVTKDINGELTKENISDTLYPDTNEFGNVTFKTRKYKMGNNRIVCVAKVPSIRGDMILARAIDFKVH